MSAHEHSYYRTLLTTLPVVRGTYRTIMRPLNHLSCRKKCFPLRSWKVILITFDLSFKLPIFDHGTCISGQQKRELKVGTVGSQNETTFRPFFRLKNLLTPTVLNRAMGFYSNFSRTHLLDTWQTLLV